jgi:SOS-response transcriptional repressor LexA
MTMGERLKLARERAGYPSAAAASRRFSFVEDTYRSHENGVRNFTRDTAVVYARAYRVSVEWLYLGVGDADKKPVPLVGYVGAGAGIVAFDDGGSLDDIEPPPGIGPEAVAVKVRGDSMYPRYMEGDVLIYDRHIPVQKADGLECIVSLVDGRKFVKIVRAEGRTVATLESWNAPPIRSVSVEWVAPILWVRRA